jgi:hypothetical protein
VINVEDRGRKRRHQIAVTVIFDVIANTGTYIGPNVIHNRLATGGNEGVEVNERANSVGYFVATPEITIAP